MKFINVSLWALCCMAISCSKSTDPTDDVGRGGTGVERRLDFTPIEDLNQGSSAVRAHADVTSRSALMMKYRSDVEIRAGETKVDAPVDPRVKKMANGKYIMF